MEIKSIEMVYELYETPAKRGAKSVALSTYYQKTPLKYIYENDSLKINLGREFIASEEYNVLIEYVSKPNELKKGGSDAISDDKGLLEIPVQG